MHFLWQGAVVAGVAAAAFWLFRHRSAQARYLAGCTGLLVMLFVPLTTFWLVQEASPSSSIPVGSEPAQGPCEVHLRDNDGSPIPSSIGPRLRAEPPSVVQHDPLLRAETPNVSRWPGVAARLRPLLPWFVAGWLLGVAGLMVQHAGGWMRVQRLRHRQTKPAPIPMQATLQHLMMRLQVSRPVKMLQSALVEVPTLIGWLRPVILLPINVVTGLSVEQLEAVLAHELAHVRRHDYLVNLLQTLVETLLFYHPAVWWLSKQIRQERENCCDDVAAAVCTNRIAYVRCMLAMEELRAEETYSWPWRPAAAFFCPGSAACWVCRLSNVGRRPIRWPWCWR